MPFTVKVTTQILHGEGTQFRAQFSPYMDFRSEIINSLPSTVDEFDLIKFQVSNLDPSRLYYVRIISLGNDQIVNRYIGSFRTPTHNSIESFTFGFASCSRSCPEDFYICDEEYKASNSPIYDNILSKYQAEELEFFIHLGDIHYKDIAINDEKLYQRAFNDVFSSPRQNNCWKNVPMYYMWDDHDYGSNDSDVTNPSRNAAIAAYRRRVPSPILASSNQSTAPYYSFVRGRVRFIVTDVRSERSPKGSYPSTDARQVIFGDNGVQKNWFFNELDQARINAQVIVWVNTLPWVSSIGNGKDDWGGYHAERLEIVDFINAYNLNDRMFIISADMHAIAYDDGSSINNYGNLKVCHAGPLDQTPSSKGGPYTIGPISQTDSKGFSNQYGIITIIDSGGDTVNVYFKGISINQFTLIESEVLNVNFALDSSIDLTILDGRHQTAVVSSINPTLGGGYLYVSSDYGITWNPKSVIKKWSDIFINSDGSFQAAMAPADGLYISRDYGETWVFNTLTSMNQKIAGSYDGKYLTMAGPNALKRSSDSGVTWSNTIIPVTFTDIAMSVSGQYQTAVTYNNKIYRSTNYGQNWASVDVHDAQRLTIDMSNDGRYQWTATSELTGKIFVSNDFGATWSLGNGPVGFINRIRINGNSKYILAVESNYAYLSRDSGVTFEPVYDLDGMYIQEIAISNRGQYQTATQVSGYIFTSYNYGNTWTMMNQDISEAWSAIAMNKFTEPVSLPQISSSSSSSSSSLLSSSSSSSSLLFPSSSSSSLLSSSSSSNSFGNLTVVDNFIQYMYDKLYLYTPSSQQMIQHKSVIGLDNFTTMNQRARVLMDILGFNSLGSINNINSLYSQMANPIVRTYERFRPYNIPNLTINKYYEILTTAQTDFSVTQFPGGAGPGTYNSQPFNNMNGLRNGTIKAVNDLAINSIPSIAGSEPNKTIAGLPDCGSCNCSTVKTAHCFVQLNMLPNWGGIVGGSDTALVLYSFVLNNFPNHTYGANFSVLHHYFSTIYYFLASVPGLANLRDFEHRMATMFLNLVLLNQWPSSVNNVDPISQSVVESILTTHLNNL